MQRFGRLALVSALLLAGACADDGESGGSTTAAPAGGDVTTTASGGGEATTTTEAAGDCVTDLAIVNGAAEELEDRAIEPVSVLADEGPHPDNTVDYDSGISIAVSEVEIVEDPQFGLGIPIGAPDGLGEDDYYLSLSLYLRDGGTIGVGQSFTDTVSFEEGDFDGEINSSGFYHGSDRLLGGQFVVTITELTDEIVCGEIATVTDTDLQTFIGIQGTFAAERIQAIEAREG